jgi:hypothetical protein
MSNQLSFEGEPERRATQLAKDYRQDRFATALSVQLPIYGVQTLFENPSFRGVVVGISELALAAALHHCKRRDQLEIAQCAEKAQAPDNIIPLPEIEPPKRQAAA